MKNLKKGVFWSFLQIWERHEKKVEIKKERKKEKNMQKRVIRVYFHTWIIRA